jgi:hypothetical protein
MIERLIERLAALGAAVRVPIVVSACGLAIGVGAFWATSFQEPHTFLGPLGIERTLRMPGTDPITGEPYGRTYIRSDAFTDPPVVSREVVVEPPPADMHPAIPVPVGTAIGILVALIVRRRVDRRQSAERAVGALNTGPAPS